MVSSLFWRYKMKKIRELRADEIEVRNRRPCYQ